MNLSSPCHSLSGSPHCPFPTEQHLQEKQLFLLLLARTGSLIPTVFTPVPQCCITREGWALLLPHSSSHRGWVLAAAQAPPQQLPLTPRATGYRAPWGIPAASKAQLHSPGCASCSTCLSHPSPVLLHHSQPWATLTRHPLCSGS